MLHQMELLAPGGDLEAIKAAIVAGTDAIYLGLNKFNARNRATNVCFEDLQGIIRIAHQHNCKVFLTLNIIIVDSEIPAIIKLLNRLTNTNIDGVIIQDLGLFYIINTYFPPLCIHASTQLTTHNSGQLDFLKQLHAERVNLCRELSISEIKDLTLEAHKRQLMTEVFVHGSYCISFSGLCYMSSLHGGNSGNRGRCSQPCRDKFERTKAGYDYPLNLKDNSAFTDLKELHNAKVDSLKIEGRIKEAEYVYTTVNEWRKQIDTFVKSNEISVDKTALYTVFNRDFSNGFLQGNISKEMFIDNPMSHSSTHFANLAPSNEIASLYASKEQLRTQIKAKTAKLDTEKIELSITVTGRCDEKLKLQASTTNGTFVIESKSTLANKGTEALTLSILKKRLVAIEETEYSLEQINWQVESPVYIPFKELTIIKKELLYQLCNRQDYLSPVKINKLKHRKTKVTTPKLAVLINDIAQANELPTNDLTIYYQLPNHLGENIDEWLSLFSENTQLTPWFPSILIGEEYTQAVQLLSRLKPETIVTNNTGIAMKAHKQGIKWVAGPQLNITNSHALLTLKDEFNASGAFISNEISQEQMRTLKCPDDFELHYSIYHPIELMTSRQCFFHQVSSCHKDTLDDNCLSDCQKTATISHPKGYDFIINKSRNTYHQIYSKHPKLNTEIVENMNGRIATYMVDLREINELSHQATPKDIKLFEELISGNTSARDELQQLFNQSDNTQYNKGI